MANRELTKEEFEQWTLEMKRASLIIDAYYPVLVDNENGKAWMVALWDDGWYLPGYEEKFNDTAFAEIIYIPIILPDIK